MMYVRFTKEYSYKIIKSNTKKDSETVTLR